MKLRLSVTAPNGMTKNLRITADATATVGDVAAGLAGTGPMRAVIEIGRASCRERV